MRLTIAVLMACLFFVGVASAQSSSATVTGRVLDATNSVIADAKVVAVNLATNIKGSGETNLEGIYVVPNLLPGTYRIEVSKQGFKMTLKPDVVLHVQDVIAINFTLQVGSSSESITVEAGAPLLDTESAAVSTVVDRHFVENLPLNGRSFQTLIALTPGVVLTKSQPGSTGTEGGQFSVNGQRADGNYFTIDGTSANISTGSGFAFGQTTSGTLPGFSAFGSTNTLVSVDAMQEFRVQTSTYAAEFGRSPGGQIEITTRPGTNSFTFSLFEYLRNDVFDANDWFADSRGLRKPPIRQNDFGGVLGGPIIKNRTFFFFSYEGLRLRQPQVEISDVPTIAARQGAIPAMQPFLSAFPKPTGPEVGNGYAEFDASYANPTSLDARSIRIDHTVSSKLALFGRYNDSPSSIQTRSGSASLSTVRVARQQTRTLTLVASYFFTPQISNETRANYSSNRSSLFSFIDPFGGAAPPADATVFPYSGSSRDSQMNFLLLDGTRSQLSVGKSADNIQHQVNLVDNLSLESGLHRLKFGVDYRRLTPVLEPQNFQENVLFFSVSDAMAGNAFVTTLTRQAGPLYPRFTNLSLYAQDSWHATPRLVLTYGLRWDLNPAPSEKNGHNPLAVTGLDNPSTLAVAPNGAPLYMTQYANVAPRLGAAYRLASRPGFETVLRGGYGIFYDMGNSQDAAGFANPPFRATTRLIFTSFPLTQAQSTPPAVPGEPPYQTVYAFEPNLNLPYTHQWNAALEQALGTTQTLTVSYVGAIGRRLLRQEGIVNPNATFVNVFVTKNTGTSDYHALQVQYQHRLSHGLQGLVSYAWSHSIDTASNDSSLFLRSDKIAALQDRGPSDFDVRHNLSTAITYDLPSGHAQEPFRAILRDWSVDGIVYARTATPVDVTVARDIGFGLGSFRPDLLPGVPLYLDAGDVPGGRLVNQAAFSVPTELRQGTFARNGLRSLGMWQANLAVRRAFSITERLKLQLRGELFNIFNHPNFADPVTVLGVPEFGQPTSMLAGGLGSGTGGGLNPLYQIGGPRSVQLSLRLSF